MLDKMKYPREEILARVKENRSKHEKDLELANKGYELEVIEQLNLICERSLRELKKVEKKGIQAWKTAYFHVNAEKPEDHLKDYDQVIDMLEMATVSELELDRAEFTRYVRDEWDWSAKFTATTSNYISKHNLS